MSKNNYYENLCTIIGSTQHTGLKTKPNNLSEKINENGTWKAGNVEALNSLRNGIEESANLRYNSILTPVRVVPQYLGNHDNKWWRDRHESSDIINYQRLRIHGIQSETIKGYNLIEICHRG